MFVDDRHLRSPRCAEVKPSCLKALIFLVHYPAKYSLYTTPGGNRHFPSQISTSDAQRLRLVSAGFRWGAARSNGVLAEKTAYELATIA